MVALRIVDEAIASPSLIWDTVWDGFAGDYAAALPSEPGNRGGLRARAPLETAILLCLMTDGRARPEDAIPDGSGDRRGWAGDMVDPAARPLGSRLWLLHRNSLDADTANLAALYAREALQTLIDQGAVASIDVTGEAVLDLGRLACRSNAIAATASLPSPPISLCCGIRLVAFNIPSIPDLGSRIRNAFRAYLPGTDALIEPNNLSIAGKTFALVFFEAYQRLGFLYKQMFASTADGEHLEFRHAADYGIVRKPATAATGLVTLTQVTPGAQTVAAGLVLVRDDGVLYATLDPAVMSAGAATVAVRARARRQKWPLQAWRAARQFAPGSGSPAGGATPARAVKV